MSDGAGAVTFGPNFIRTSRLSARITFFHLLGEGKVVDAVHPASDCAPLVAHTLDAFAAAAARMLAHTVSQGVMLSTCIFCGQCFVSVIAFEPECVEKRTMARPERDLASVWAKALVWQPAAWWNCSAERAATAASRTRGSNMGRLRKCATIASCMLVDQPIPFNRFRASASAWSVRARHKRCQRYEQRGAREGERWRLREQRTDGLQER